MSVGLLLEKTKDSSHLRKVQAGESTGPLISNVSDLGSVQLHRQFEAVREAERKRLSRELHDQIGQDLVAISLGLLSLKKKIEIESEAFTQLGQVQEIVAHLDQRIHDFAWELRPLILDDLGLRAALVTLIEQWAKRNHIKATFHSINLDRLNLAQDIKCGIYRILQESLTNIAKHSRANLVSVTIKFRSGLLLITIKDNGQGFDIAAVQNSLSNTQKFGILGMFERAELMGGTINIESKRDSGTTIKISIPVTAKKAGNAKTSHLSC
ncbi:MAG: sensor histidine kinase [Acidobacteria bacterium]|nr:sensor histidine kinase [Acidobacteriota bacterium]